MTFEKGDIFANMIKGKLPEYGVLIDIDLGRYIITWDWCNPESTTSERFDIESGNYPLVTSIFREEFV